MDWMDSLLLASTVLGALVSVATVVAPWTTNKLDDKAVGWLGFVKGIVDRLRLTK